MIPCMAASPLQKELRQRRPFESPAHEAVLSLFRTADCLRRLVAATVEAQGITPQQFNVLRILRGAEGAAMPTLDIAERMVEQTPGITRLLDRLEARGLISRTRSIEDRRQVLCAISPDGLAVLAKLDGPVRAANERVMSGLPISAQRQLIRLLERVRAGGLGGLERCHAARRT